MIRVKLRPVLMSLPHQTDGDDFDIEVEDSVYDLMEKAMGVLREISAACSPSIGVSQPSAKDRADALLSGKPPVSQVDPPIDTRVRDSEMRPREREISLQEFLEPPERTRSAPRPRAHSWRHGNG